MIRTGLQFALANGGFGGTYTQLAVAAFALGGVPLIAERPVAPW